MKKHVKEGEPSNLYIDIPFHIPCLIPPFISPHGKPGSRKALSMPLALSAWIACITEVEPSTMVRIKTRDTRPKDHLDMWLN